MAYLDSVIENPEFDFSQLELSPKRMSISILARKSPKILILRTARAIKRLYLTMDLGMSFIFSYSTRFLFTHTTTQDGDAPIDR